MSTQFSNDIRVGRSRLEVWNFLTSPGAATHWIQDAVAIKQLDEGDLGRGSRLRLRLNRRTIEVTVSYWEPQTCFTLAYRTPHYLLDTTVRLTDGVGGTLVTVNSSLVIVGIRRLLLPLYLMIRRREVTRRLAILKRALESVESSPA